VSARDTRVSWEADFRAWRAPPDRLKPHERAIDGPAVYPTTAPATAPIGPNTTAPDKAPSAASPPRCCASVADGTSAANTNAVIAIVFFFKIRPILARQQNG
jgi:hypothetical protein